MLSDPQRVLIAAAVDGTLSAEAAAEFREILAGSSESLALFQALQSQSGRLASLPRLSAPPASYQRILRSVENLPTSRPARRKSVETPLRITRRWPVYAVAASALFAVGIGPLWAFRDRFEPNRAVAQVATTRPHPGVTESAEFLPAPHLAPVLYTTVASVGSVASHPAESAPRPRVMVEQPLIGASNFPLADAVRGVDVQLPVVTTASAIDEIDLDKLVAGAQTRANIVLCDLFASDTVKGVRLVREAARAANISVVTDAATAARIEHGQHATWVLYTGGLDKSRRNAWLGHIAAMSRQSVPSPLNDCHVSLALVSESRELDEIFGLPAGKSESGITPAADSGTLAELAQALGGRPPELVVATYGPAAIRSSANRSAELQSFSARHLRGDAKQPRWMIVIRPLD